MVSGPIWPRAQHVVAVRKVHFTGSITSGIDLSHAGTSKQGFVVAQELIESSRQMDDKPS